MPEAILKKIIPFIFIPFMLFAQIPDHFTNLTVLPKTISKDNLLNVMRNFTEGLGVRCNFCHVGDEGKPLSTYDFAADDKDNKRIARVMLKMTNNINEEYLSQVKEIGDMKEENIIEVKCITCHHGVNKPETLAEKLMSVVKKKGVDEAVNTYHDLYKQYYGSASYNFKDNSLAELSHMLIQDTNYAAAIKISDLNIEMYPNSGLAYFTLGESYEASGDRAKALENIKKSLELSPNNMMFSRRLQQLENSK
jgi:tetratricopeptide (TPR) repeat protein